MKYFFIFCAVIIFCSCTKPYAPEYLSSWSEGDVKQRIIEFLEIYTDSIPVEDRIAVFDLDGTIACESPLWFEMYVAVDRLNSLAAENPELLGLPEYDFAKRLFDNPFDSLVQKQWVTPNANYIDSMIWKAFEGVDSEDYITYANNLLSNSKSKDDRYDRTLSSLFYQPMIELLHYLKAKEYTVYIVSGSLQGLLWSICPQELGFDRDKLIGTRQLMSVDFSADSEKLFVLNKGIYLPKNDGYGKAENIYSHIGKKPVFAFGNTIGDFGMFHLASSNMLPNISFMLNHDDLQREYVYPPYHGKSLDTWKDSLDTYKWNLVSMKNDFETLWVE